MYLLEQSCCKAFTTFNPKCIDLVLTNSPNSFKSFHTVETGLSDFHKMTIVVNKLKFEKLKPSIIKYRDYSHYNGNNFRGDLVTELNRQTFSSEMLESFLSICKNVVDKHAPLKKKYVRGNQAPFMNKELSKAFMIRSRLRNCYLKNKTINNQIAYKKQRNYCVGLLKRTKRDYYGNLDEKNNCDNKIFWKTVKPLLSNKNIQSERIILTEGDNIVNDDKSVSEILNNFFINIVNSLNLPKFKCLPSLENDPVLRAIDKYQNHPSIVKIKEKINTKEFSFQTLERNDIIKMIMNLNTSKSCQQSDIPTKIITENSELFADFLLSAFNNTIQEGNFPAVLKNADVTPIFKQGSRHVKGNYRPISILSNISKIFERPLFDQISCFFDSILSPYQCGFRKGFNTQNCLLAMLENWKLCNDNKQFFGALLTDLSKAFDCMSHELLIAKLHAYGFSKEALNLIHSYLSNRKQRTKIGDIYSVWDDILNGVPQGSILGPLLFNIFVCDMFFFLENTKFASFADDNTPYFVADNLNDLINYLGESATSLRNWFMNNEMKANPDKFQLILNSSNNYSIDLDGIKINNTNEVNLLGIKFDRNLTFEDHVRDICNKANTKLNALSRTMPYMNMSKRKKVINASFFSQFNYCPLIWMLHKRELNNRIDRLHERCLRLMYNDKHSSFQELLLKSDSITIHHKNIKALAIEMFKVFKGLAPEIISNLFEINTNSYNLRNKSYFKIPNVHTVYNGTESISFLGPKLWNILPDDLRMCKTLEVFKSRIKSWIPDNCPCRICKTYIEGVGFI